MARKPSRRDPIPALEWVAAALGLVVILAILAVLATETARSADDHVPHLSARIEAVTVVPGGYVAEVVVANGAGQAAASVHVEGKLGDEAATATIDYVPGNSEGKGGLLFKGDPRRRPLEVRVTGYELP